MHSLKHTLRFAPRKRSRRLSVVELMEKCGRPIQHRANTQPVPRFGAATCAQGSAPPHEARSVQRHQPCRFKGPWPGESSAIRRLDPRCLRNTRACLEPTLQAAHSLRKSRVTSDRLCLNMIEPKTPRATRQKSRLRNTTTQARLKSLLQVIRSTWAVENDSRQRTTDCKS